MRIKVLLPCTWSNVLEKWRQSSLPTAGTSRYLAPNSTIIFCQMDRHEVQTNLEANNLRRKYWPPSAVHGAQELSSYHPPNPQQCQYSTPTPPRGPFDRQSMYGAELDLLAPDHAKKYVLKTEITCQSQNEK